MSQDQKYCHICRSRLIQRIVRKKAYVQDWRNPKEKYAYLMERRCPKWMKPILNWQDSNGHYRREWRVWESQIPEKWQENAEWYLKRIMPPPILFCDNWSG